MPSLFLHRISVVHVYLYITVTAQDPVGQVLRQGKAGVLQTVKESILGGTRGSVEDGPRILPIGWLPTLSASIPTPFCFHFHSLLSSRTECI